VVGWMFTFAAAAYRLVRIRNLTATPVGAASGIGVVCLRSSGKTARRYKDLPCRPAYQGWGIFDSA
jgi:hypothetical protein